MKVEFIIEGENGPSLVDTIGELVGELSDTINDGINSNHHYVHRDHHIIDKHESRDYFGFVTSFMNLLGSLTRLFR